MSYERVEVGGNRHAVPPSSTGEAMAALPAGLDPAPRRGTITAKDRTRR